MLGVIIIMVILKAKNNCIEIVITIHLFFRRKNLKTGSTRNSKDSKELELMVSVGKNKIKVKQSARKLIKEVVRAFVRLRGVFFTSIS
jgi:hypothetical protein